MEGAASAAPSVCIKKTAPELFLRGGTIFLFAQTLAVFLCTEVQGHQGKQHHDTGDAEEVLLGNVDDMAVNIVNGGELGGVLDDEVTGEGTHEHGDQGEEDDFHAFQSAAALLGEQDFDPDGGSLSDEHIACAHQEHEEEQVQIVNAEEIGGIDGFGGDTDRDSAIKKEFDMSNSFFIKWLYAILT